MNNHEKLKEGVSLLERELNKWAHEEGILAGAESLVVEVRLNKSGQIGKMRVEDFFTRARLTQAGATKSVATRVVNCLYQKVYKHKPNMNMDEFLRGYDVNTLIRWKNMGRDSLHAMVNAVKEEGAEIKDPNQLLD